MTGEFGCSDLICSAKPLQAARRNAARWGRVRRTSPSNALCVPWTPSGNACLMTLTLVPNSRLTTERKIVSSLARRQMNNRSIVSSDPKALFRRCYIAASGLWNLNHLFLRPDPTFLDVLERYVNVTLGHEAEPGNPIAPDGWHSLKPSES